jgi:hypothetical protein
VNYFAAASIRVRDCVAGCGERGLGLWAHSTGSHSFREEANESNSSPFTEVITGHLLLMMTFIVVSRRFRFKFKFGAKLGRSTLKIHNSVNYNQI